MGDLQAEEDFVHDAGLDRKPVKMDEGGGGGGGEPWQLHILEPV